MNKREFIRAACATAAGCTLPAWPAAALASGAAAGRDAAMWRDWVGQSFALAGDDGLHIVTLTDVRQIASPANQAQFTLVFDGATALPTDAIRTLRHASGRRFDLFVEAVTNMPGRLVAQFSLLT
jgi:hypothetical protein